MSYLDNDGYPTVEALKKIGRWDHNDHFGLMEFVQSLWRHPDWGWEVKNKIPSRLKLHKTDKGKYYHISTAGWSGNEDLILAMIENTLFWRLCWVSSTRGGHYEFVVEERS